MDPEQQEDDNLTDLDMEFFEQEAERLKKEFDLKTEEILNRIRERRLNEIKNKIQS